MERYLTQLRQMGVSRHISALVVGRFPSATGFSENDPLEAMLTIATRGYSFPVVYDVDFGHTDLMITLANGTWASLDADHRVEFKYTEPTVFLG